MTNLPKTSQSKSKPVLNADVREANRRILLATIHGRLP